MKVLNNFLKTLSLAAILCILCLSLLACNKANPVQTAPMHLNLRETRLTWDATQGAVGYILDINGTRIFTKNAEYKLDELPAGASYKISVASVADENDLEHLSAWTAPITIDKFTSPQNVEINENDELIWLPSKGATGYMVVISDMSNSSVKTVNYTANKFFETPKVSVSDLKPGYYKINIAPYGTAEINLSEQAVTDYHKSIFTYTKESFSNSSENIHLAVYFKLRENFTFDGYNFTSANPDDQLSEYTQMYSDFFSGDTKKQAAAAAKIGNDIIFEYAYESENGQSVPLTFKCKAWDGYLNRYYKPGDEYEAQKLAGNYIDQTFDHVFYYTTSYNISGTMQLQEFKDRKLIVNLYLILDGEIFSERFEYTVR